MILGRKWFIWSVLTLSALVLATISGLISFRYMQTQRVDDTSDQLVQYIAERGVVEQYLFRSIAQKHRSAYNLYYRIYTKLEVEDAAQRFNTLFPLKADGTRRSVDQLFDGITTQEGSPVYGIGGYIRHGNALSDDDKRRLLAGYLTLRQMGPAYEAQFSNFQFFDAQNNVIIFAPHRSDRLEFYRKTAPADLDFSQEDQVQGSLPTNNPTEQTRCTPLTVLLFRPDDPAMHVGCYTPMRLDGRHMGAFGISLNVTQYLQSAVSRPPENGENFILNHEGALVVHSDLLTPGEDDEETLQVLQARLDGAEIAQAVHANGRMTGVLTLSDGHSIAFSRIPAPNWIFISRIDKKTRETNLLPQALIWSGLAFLLIMSQGPGLVSLLTHRPLSVDDVDPGEGDDVIDPRELLARRSAKSGQSQESAHDASDAAEPHQDPRTD